jgi:outer membrane protein assembly factor BamB
MQFQRNYTLSIIALFLHSSCTEAHQPQEIKSNTVQTPKILWKSEIATKSLLNDNLPMLIYKNGLFSNSQFQDKEKPCLRSLKDGSIIWVGDSLRNTSYLFVYPPLYHYDSLVVFRSRTLLACINLDNGKVKWQQTIRGGLQVTTLGKQYFYGDDNACFWKGNILTGQQDTILTVGHPKAKGAVPRTIAPFVNAARDTLLIMTYWLDFSYLQTEARYILYNLTQKRVLYDQVLMPPSRNMTGIMGIAQIYKNNIYFVVGYSIFCHNMKTGKQVWKKEFDGMMLRSNMQIIEDKVVTFCDGLNPRLTVLDAVTGKEQWQHSLAGNCGAIFCMNNVLYFTSSADGMLHAIDFKTGKRLWKFLSPDIDTFSEAYFWGNVVGKDGKIYARTYRNLYCLKAAR